MKELIIGILAVTSLAALLVALGGAKISSECSRLEEKKDADSKYNHGQ